VVCHFCSPPLTPPPLSTPAGVERGAWILFRRVGNATTARDVTTAPSLPYLRAHGRRELAPICTPRLAAAPASDETCLVHSRPRSDRCPWHANAQPLTTTAGQKCRPANHGGDASCRRSLSKTPKAKSRLPSLPPAGGREGRGGEWGERKAS